MKLPSIGVIVPFFNREDYLELTAKAVLAQQVPNHDVFLFMVDDGSTDRSQAIAEKIVRRNENAFLVVHKENRGIAKAMNLGATAAIRLRGVDYIFNQSSDDLLVGTDALAKMIVAMGESGADFCSPGMAVFGDEKRTYIPPLGVTFSQQVESNKLVGAFLSKTTMWEALGGYTDDFLEYGRATWEDYDYSTRALQRGYSYCITKEPTYMWRRHKGAATNEIRKHRENKMALRKAFTAKFKNGTTV